MTTTATIARKFRPSASTLIGWSGLAAVAAGLVFAGIQPIHPPDYLASVTTGIWATFMYLKLAMCLFFLIGIAGLYSRQADRAGLTGLVGFLLLTVTWFLQSCFIFTEGFILPVIAGAAPQYVELPNARQRDEAVDGHRSCRRRLRCWHLLHAQRIVFGIAAVRANSSRKERRSAMVAAVLTPAPVLLPPSSSAGIPVGLAIAWLGYQLVAEPACRAAGRSGAGCGAGGR